MLEAKSSARKGGGAATIHAVLPRALLSRVRNTRRNSDQADGEDQLDAVGGVGGSTREPVQSTPRLLTADTTYHPDQRSGENHCEYVGIVGGSTIVPVQSVGALLTADATYHHDQCAVENHNGCVGIVGGSTNEVVQSKSQLLTVDVTYCPDQRTRETQRIDVGTVGGSTIVQMQSDMLVSIADVCLQIVDDQRVRCFCIKSQSRIDRSTESFIARLMGFHSGLEEKERKKIFKAASKLRKAVEKGNGEDQIKFDDQAVRVLSVCLPLIIGGMKARQYFDDQRLATEKRMRANARLLPGWSFVKGVRGVGELGLAVIVGEAGDLSVGGNGRPDNYANPAKLWKRLGLSVEEGVRQGGLPKGASADDWIRHGYSPRRRAQIWSMFDDVMFCGQWGRDPGENKDVPTHALGPYGEMYDRYKEYQLGLGLKKGHAHNRARRVMTKRFLRDLWVAWRSATVGLSQDHPPPAASARPMELA